MDLTTYYQSIREAAAKMDEADVVVESLKGGVLTEVPRHVAARLVVEGKAQPTTPEQAEDFRARQRQAKRAADQEAEARRMQVTMMPQSIIDRLRLAERQE